MFDLLDQLSRSSLGFDPYAATGDAQFGAGGEGAGNDDARRVGRDVYEAARAGGNLRARGEPGDVDVALTVDLQER